MKNNIKKEIINLFRSNAPRGNARTWYSNICLVHIKHNFKG